MELTGIRKDIRFQNSQGIRQVMPALVPAFRSEFETWTKVPEGKQLKIKVTRPRSAEKNFHDQIMAVLHFTYMNWPEAKYKFKTFDLFRKWLYIEIEFVDVLEGPDGKVYKIPRSVAFDKLDHLEFMSSVYNQTLDYCGDVLKMSRDDLIAASIEYGYNRKLYRGG